MYKIKLLTKTGIIEVTYNDTQDLTAFETELTNKYGDFVQLECNKIA